MLGRVKGLLERFKKRDERALARAISLIEGGSAEAKQLLHELRPSTSKSHIIGITGSPGSGKSTLTDSLIGSARERDQTVAVLAVDPSSPYTGGAILGDRIRMVRWHEDKDVYIRSMATRGHLGGLAAATLQVLVLLEAYGFDAIFIETVGVGQSEVDIVNVADTTLLVLTPGQGDAVQAFKAGIMEIADIFVINKADLAGSARIKREVQAMLEIGGSQKDGWKLPILETVASKSEGVKALFEALGSHRSHLADKNRFPDLRKKRARFEIAAMLSEQLRLSLAKKEDAFIEQVLAGKLPEREAIKALLFTISDDIE